VETNALLITWEGRPATLNFLRDITEKKTLEEHFHEAQKMEAVGILAASAAHDFNNLLMGIMGQVSLMLLDMKPEAPYRERLKQIERYADSGARLPTGLTTVALRAPSVSPETLLPPKLRNGIQTQKHYIPTCVFHQLVHRK